MRTGSVALSTGRVVELHEPTFGEEIHVVAQGADDLEELMYAKCAVICPSMSREEIANLPREDGRKLIMAVGRIWDGRTEEEDRPFENGSASRSMDSAVQSLNTTS